MGRSDVVHEFSEIVTGSGIELVVDILHRECTEIDVIRMRIRSVDVAARLAEIRAPSFTEQALKLAPKTKHKNHKD
ncbi:MAG: hypothetical protein NXY59_10185 [Aigarchaeota archaeon]|nr:hypothetical protein [Candidatus Pelearchaeum maunauluense]